MKDIAIYGAGGLGREVACLIDRVNSTEKKWNIIGYIDDGIPVGTIIDHHGSVIGNIDTVNNYGNELDLVLAIGSPKIVRKIIEKINNPNVSFPNVICPSFDIVDPPTFSIGKGNVIKNLCRVSCNVKIGDFNMFNGMVVVGHDVSIGSFNSFMPTVRISGEVTVGEANFFGIGSMVLQGVNIGNDIRLGAGSVLIKSPKDGNLYWGNPAKKTEF